MAYILLKVLVYADAEKQIRVGKNIKTQVK